MIGIDPQEIKGAWDQGYVLDVHTISSTMIGYNEFGYAGAPSSVFEGGPWLFNFIRTIFHSSFE